MNSFKLIKIINSKHFFVDKFNKIQNQVYQLAYKKTMISIIGNNIVEIINLIGYITLIMVSVYEILKGNLTIGGLVAFNTYSNNFINSLFNLCNLNIVIQETIVSINRISSIFDNDGDYKSMKIKKFTIDKEEDDIKKIYIKKLEFYYPKSDFKLFSNFNLVINKNQLTIIKGVSGTGKTTLFNIISGLYKDYNGEIYFGDINIKNIPEEILREKVFFMEQETCMFTGTIKENLLMGKSNISDEKIEDICKKVNIHDSIQSLCEKYDTQIGELGVSFSVGQKQRLALARALIRNADIYLFDEVTSALDSKNEEIIMNVLKEISTYKTVVLISHRNTTFKYADSIIDLAEITNREN